MTVQIILQLPAGGEQKVTLPDNIEVGRLVPALVSKLALSSVADDGHALIYELAVAGQTLPEAETLGSIGIVSGTKVDLSASRAEWPIAAQPPRASSSRINSWPPALNSTPEPETIQWQDPIRIGPENHRIVQWARSRWKLLLFVGFLIWRAAVSLFPTQSEPRQLAPLALTTTPEGATLESTMNVQDFVDSPVFVADHLYFLFEDELGYGLWQIDFSSEAYTAERIMTVRGSRASGYELIVEEDVLYFKAGRTEKFHYLSPGEDVAVPLPFTVPYDRNPPVRLPNTWLFSLTHTREQQLYACIDVLLNEEIQPIEPTSIARPISSTCELSGGQFASQTTQLSRPLPVMVDHLWYMNQATLNGINYFGGIDVMGDAELWRTDGTVEGTFLVKDIREGTLGSRPTNFIAFDGYVFFSATNDDSQIELWRSDGTEAGTIQLFDLNDWRNSSPGHLHVAGGQLFFSAEGLDQQRVFWRTDADSTRPDLVDSPLGLGWKINELPFQYGVTSDSHVHIATSSSGQSLIVRQQVENSTGSWSSFDSDAHLSEIHVAGELILVMDDNGYFHRYHDGSFSAVARLPRFGQVVSLEQRGFAIIGTEGELWLYTGAEPQVIHLLETTLSLPRGN